MADTFYVTTPIYYVNAKPHLGHAYATILADTLSKFNRLAGREVMFLTGTDEHGQKLENAASEAGKTPQEFVDEIVKTFQELWVKLRIGNDDFIRTTQPRHEEVVRVFFQKMFDNGDIYLGEYEGLYCTPCEKFWTRTELGESENCPWCKRPTQAVKEESYFFRLSKYRDALLDFYKVKNPGFVVPQSKFQELINRVEAGLDDISVSRTTVKWGITVPFDEKHTVYVWFDALINYVSAIGYPDPAAKFGRFWPADYHVIGKDIMWFHGVIWPAMLMSAGLPPPLHLLVTGFWLKGEEKMSKSKGNVIDPEDIVAEYGIDAMRYFFLKEMAIGQDASISMSSLAARLNADLANDYGNLLHRTANLVNKFLDGVMPGGADENLRAELAQTAAETADLMNACRFRDALESVWQFVRRMNKYIDEQKPWALAKSDPEAMKKVLATVLEVVRSTAILTYPVLPNTTEKIFGQLSLDWSPDALRWEHATQWGAIEGRKLGTIEPLFPRIKIE